MKTLVLISLNLMLFTTAVAQGHEQAIIDLVDQYGKARTEKNVAMLNSILVEEVDQLVSTGEWRRGLEESLAGMMRSSTRQPGSRSLSVEKVRFITDRSAIADARYVIDNGDGTERRMWSTFIAVLDGDQWKIAAIRNMLPRK